MVYITRLSVGYDRRYVTLGNLIEVDFTGLKMSENTELDARK